MITGDTIAAIASPMGVGGVGVVRISGPRAVELAAALVGRLPESLADRMMCHGVARDAVGERLDQVLVVAMRGPRSYTGEDVAEVHGHGGTANMSRLLRAVVAAGARVPEPGEFTRRAYLNGKLDLTEVEAVADVIEAGSERALRIAHAQLAGELGQRVRQLRTAAVELLAEVEASVDFPEEDLDVMGSVTVAARAVDLAWQIEQLAASYAWGRALRAGVSVALVGPVNAGKSSLFNRLVGERRAIVTAEPGTTRDFVEARTVWDGVPVTVIDTAGVRDHAESEAEAVGIELSRQRAAAADLKIVAHERTAAPRTAPPDARERAELHVVTKGDLGPVDSELLVTSAETGAGVAALQRAVVQQLGATSGDADEGAVVTSERQRDLLRRAAAAVRAAGQLAECEPAEIVAIELGTGLGALAELLGEQVGEQVLDALFSRFCIGK